MQKLKIYDLSVGDWVQWNDKTYRVCLIDGVSLTVKLAEEAGGTIEVAIDEVTGIPLTIEIFEKNGLVRDPIFPDIHQLNLVNGEREDVVTFCEELGVECRKIAPKHNTTKLSASQFKVLTGWQGRTSDHARDAAMLVFGR